MKGYFYSTIDCSKNHDEKLKNIALRLIQVYSERIGAKRFQAGLLIADCDFSSHPTVITTNVIQGRGGIRRNLKGQSSVCRLAVRDPTGVFANGVSSTGTGG